MTSTERIDMLADVQSGTYFDTSTRRFILVLGNTKVGEFMDTSDIDKNRVINKMMWEWVFNQSEW